MHHAPVPGHGQTLKLSFQAPEIRGRPVAAFVGSGDNASGVEMDGPRRREGWKDVWFRV